MYSAGLAFSGQSLRGSSRSARLAVAETPDSSLRSVLGEVRAENVRVLADPASA